MLLFSSCSNSNKLTIANIYESQILEIGSAFPTNENIGISIKGSVPGPISIKLYKEIKDGQYYRRGNFYLTKSELDTFIQVENYGAKCIIMYDPPPLGVKSKDYWLEIKCWHL